MFLALEKIDFTPPAITIGAYIASNAVRAGCYATNKVGQKAPTIGFSLLKNYFSICSIIQLSYLKYATQHYRYF